MFKSAKINLNFFTKFCLKIFLSILLVLLLQNICNSQGNKIIEAKGKVVYGNIPLSNAEVSLYLGTEKIKSDFTTSEGKFGLKLEINNQYTIIASKSGFVSKKILFDSNVNTPDFKNTYQFTIELFKLIDGVNLSLFDKPIAKIAFDEIAEEFDYDKKYTQSVRKEFENIMDQVELLKKKQYDETILKADELFNNKNYTEALTYYNKAVDIDPVYDYPKKKIIECKKNI